MKLLPNISELAICCIDHKKIRHDMLEISAPREDFLVFIATNIHIVALNIAVG